MNQTSMPIETESAAIKPRRANVFSTVVLVFFIGISITAIANQLGHFWPIQPWLNAAFVVVALLASIAALAPTLAWTNVLLAAGIVVAIAGITQAINAVSGVPFGQIEFTSAAGPRLLGLIPWWLPLAWACIALTARGVARLVLHGSRGHPRHGYYVIGIATVLAALATSGLDYSGARTGFWTAHAAPLVSFSVGLALHLFIQVAITALVIDKFPGPRPRNFRPLIVLVGLVAFFVAIAF